MGIRERLKKRVENAGIKELIPKPKKAITSSAKPKEEGIQTDAPKPAPDKAIEPDRVVLVTPIHVVGELVKSEAPEEQIPTDPAFLESELLAIYKKIQAARKKHDKVNKKYWSIVRQYNTNGNSNEHVDHALVSEVYRDLIKVFSSLKIKEQKYESILDLLSFASSKDKDSLEKRLLGETGYQREIEYRLIRASEDLYQFKEQGDEEAILNAEAKIKKYEKILTEFAKKPSLAQTITSTKYPKQKPSFVPSLAQEELEKQAVKAYLLAKSANEEGIRIDEKIKNGATIKPWNSSLLKNRIQARLRYKKVLDELSAEYTGVAYERIHDLIEKRARYDETTKKVHSEFSNELNTGQMNFNDILNQGEQTINSGKYTPSMPNQRDKSAAEFFHASFELECTRELLVGDPLQSIVMQNETIKLRNSLMLDARTMICFDDMITHIQSAPPSPEQLIRMMDLRKGQEHQKNRQLNAIVWDIMSKHYSKGSYTCPIVVTAPKDLTLLGGDGVFTYSHYIAIKENPDLTVDDRKAIMAHEQTHYLAALQGGLGEKTENGKMDFTWYVGSKRIRASAWLHEGLTELYSQQLIRTHGIRSKRIGYPREVISSFYIQSLVGEDTLKQAYLSGDFTKVSNKLDSVLGYGTFEEIMNKTMAILAEEVITCTLDLIGTSRINWDENELVKLARKQLSERN